MRHLINLIEAASTEVFERCQAGNQITPSDGECGYGIYTYPIKYAGKMRRYYDDGGKRTIFRFTLKTGYVVDLTDPRIMPDLLAYARQQFARMKAQMTYYQEPKVNKSSIQRFGAIVEDFIRTNYNDAAGYTISHELAGSDLPKGKQTVITKLDHFEVMKIKDGIMEGVGGYTLDQYAARPSRFGSKDVVEEPGYLYHGTGKAKLPRLRSEGLKPSSKSRFSRDPFIGDWSIGKVFFTTSVDKAKFYAREVSKAAPLLLRVPASALPGALEDTKDTDSVYVEKAVPAPIIEYWSGSAWKPVARDQIAEGHIEDTGDIRAELPALSAMVKEETGAMLDVDMLEPDEIFLSYVERGGEPGSGGKALAMLLNFADERNMKITLTVLHNAPRLIRYYQRLGFRATEFENDAAFEKWMADHEANWNLDSFEHDEGIAMTRWPS